MSFKTRNVITAALMAAGMLVAIPSMAKTSAPQEIKVQTTVGGYMDWTRVDGTAISDPIQLQYVTNASNGEFRVLKIATNVKPNEAGKKVSFELKNDLVLTNLVDQKQIGGFSISVGGVALEKGISKLVVTDGESSFTGVNKELLVKHDNNFANKPTNGKYVGFASIVLEGEA